MLCFTRVRHAEIETTHCGLPAWTSRIRLTNSRGYLTLRQEPPGPLIDL
jgi:hypothetical protein